MILKTPAARYVAHVALMFLGVFLSMWYAANQPTDKAALVALVAAAARAVIGAVASTNPKIGANVL